MRVAHSLRHQARSQARTEARIAARVAPPVPENITELKLDKMRQCEVCFRTGVLSGEIQGRWSVFNVNRHDAVPRVVLPVIDHERFALKHFDLCKSEAGSCLDSALTFLEKVGRVSLDKDNEHTNN
jgi:hypothetical protein